MLEESSKNQAAFHDRLDERDRVLLDQAPPQNQAQISPSTSTFSGVPSLQSVQKQTLPGQELPPGNYLLVTWDGLFHNGHLLQLGAYLTDSGKSIIQNIRPVIFGDVLDDELSKRITYTKPSAMVSYIIHIEPNLRIPFRNCSGNAILFLKFMWCLSTSEMCMLTIIQFIRSKIKTCGNYLNFPYFTYSKKLSFCGNYPRK